MSSLAAEISVPGIVHGSPRPIWVAGVIVTHHPNACDPPERYFLAHPRHLGEAQSIAALRLREPPLHTVKLVAIENGLYKGGWTAGVHVVRAL
jgi:hypothetical protein